MNQRGLLQRPSLAQKSQNALKSQTSFQPRPRRRSTLQLLSSRSSLYGLGKDVTAEIIEDREQGEHLSRVKLAQGATHRQSVCIQGPVFWANRLDSNVEK